MVSNKILDKYLNKYIRIYMEDLIEGEVSETGYLLDYDKDWIEIRYPAFIKHEDYCVADKAIIERSRVRYIDVLQKKAYDIHKKDYERLIETIDKEGIKEKLKSTKFSTDRVEIN